MNISLPRPPGDPEIAIIVAMTRRGVIGDRGRLPWDIPADRRLFRRLTLGHTVIMGRRTFDSLPAALDGRLNIVISRSCERLPGALVCHTFEEGLARGKAAGRPIFVIGGVEIYRAALPVANLLHVSWIRADINGDRFFPPLDLAGWHPVAVKEHPAFQHVVYRRLRPAAG